MSLKELPLPSIASLRAIAALRSPHLALVRPARIGLGFESAAGQQKTLAEVENLLGGPGRLSLPYSLRWLLDALTGLGVLHRTLSFAHGEVQPEHLVLGEDGVGRLIPVVRAHWVRGEQRSPGRLYYLAPEKLLGDRVDVRSDVFSIGVMLWEALAGQPLLEASEVDDIIARLMSGGILRAQAPEGESWTVPLADIAARAIAVDPKQRFASVAEMKEAIESTCMRYLASAPGMAELFESPERRARNHARDTRPPESQRVTIPPTHDAQTELHKSVGTAEEQALEAAADRLARASFASIDLEDERPTLSPAARQPAPRKGNHVKTLLGVPPPFIEPRESRAAEQIASPFARTPSSIAPKVEMSAPAAPASTPATVAAGSESPRAVSLSPLVSADQPRAAVAEPSFELVRPRKRRGAVWLALGAAAAIGLFAARPWLAQQVAAAVGSLPDATLSDSDPAVEPRPATPTAPSSASDQPSAPPRAASIASTPPSPSERSAGRRWPRGQGEAHVVIDDRLQPDVSEPAPPPPVADVATPPEPAAKAPPAPQPPPPPPPRKPKAAPVSDADRYGI